MLSLHRTGLRMLAILLLCSFALRGSALADKPGDKPKDKPGETIKVGKQPGDAPPADSKPGDTPATDKKPGIDVFQAAKEKKVDAKLVQQSEKGGYLLLRNTSTELLNVRFPDSFVGVNVVGSGSSLQVGGRGTAQSTGIAINAPRGSRDTAGLFSIPPGKMLRLPITSVCLEYGKPEPNAKLRYVIMPVERYSRNPVFHELLPLFTKTKMSQRVAQAAAWHISNGLTWPELSSITNPATGSVLPMFTTNDLRLAKALVDKAAAIAIEKEAAEKRRKTSERPSIAKPETRTTPKPADKKKRGATR